MSTKILGIMFLLIGLWALASTISVGFFDVRWWVPIAKDDIGRDLTVFLVHVLGLFCLIPGLGITFPSKESE